MEVYVIYKDGEWYHPRGRKGVYFKKGTAKQVITIDSEDDAESIYENEGHWNKCYYELPKTIREEYIKRAKNHYEIRIFKDSGEVI